MNEVLRSGDVVLPAPVSLTVNDEIISHQLHAVHFYHDPLRPVLFRQSSQFLGGNGILIQDLQKHILMGIGGKIVLLLTLFKGDQQRPLAGIETLVLQSLLDEFGLTGIQKSGEYINRDLDHGLHPKQFRDLMLVKLGADNAQLTGDSSAAHADIVLQRHIVEVNPAAVCTGHDAFSPQHQAAVLRIQSLQGILDVRQRKLPGSLHAPGGKHLVCVVVMVVIVVMVMAAAGTVLTMLMMMLVVVMLVLMVVVMVLVMMFMVMVAAAAMLIVLMMMLVMMMLMLVVVAATGAVLIVLMMMVMMNMFQRCKILCQSRLAFHGFQKLSTRQLTPRRGNDGGVGIMLPEHFYGLVQLGLGDRIGPGQNDGGSSLNLVVVELAKVLHIDLDLASIHHCHGEAQGNIGIGDLLYSGDHIGQLAHAGRLDNNAVRVVLADNLGQGFAKIAYQGAADAAGIHFSDVDARVLKEAAINADLTELVFNEDQLLSSICFLNHLFDQSGLACAQKAGININFCHKKHLLYIIIQFIIAPECSDGKRLFFTCFDIFPLHTPTKNTYAYCGGTTPIATNPPTAVPALPRGGGLAMLRHRDQQQPVLLRFTLQLIGTNDCVDSRSRLFCQFPQFLSSAAP